MSSKWMKSCIPEMSSGNHSPLFFVLELKKKKCWKKKKFCLSTKAVEVSPASRSCRLHSHNTVNGWK